VRRLHLCRHRGLVVMLGVGGEGQEEGSDGATPNSSPAKAGAQGHKRHGRETLGPGFRRGTG